MIRRISKHNDLKDIIKSCPSGVIDDIYAIEYYIQGHNETIQASFTKTGQVLEVILPSTDLETLPNGILMRRAFYKVLDSSYPDSYYNLQFEDNMNIWLGDAESEPGPVPMEYVTEEELAETLEDYATQANLTTLEDSLLTEIDDTKADLQNEIEGALNLIGGCVKYNEENPLYDGYNKVITTFEPGNSYTPLLILINNEEGEDAQYDGIKIDNSGIYKYSANNYEVPGTWSETTEELATQDWVQNQGYATQQWVTGRGYLTSSSTLPASQITCNISGDVFDFDDVDEGLSALVSRVEDQIDEITLLDDRVTALEQSGSPAQWGSITGTIGDQSDLIALLGNYATESWVGQQGYITSSALSGYATQQWATNQFLEESKIWTGTQVQWSLLTPAQQASYTIALITQ